MRGVDDSGGVGEGDLPAFAGDVPVEFVVVLETAEGVVGAVVDKVEAVTVEGAVGIADFEFEVATFVGGRKGMILAVAVGDGNG